MLILPETPDKPLCLAISPDSQAIYIGCRDGRVVTWDRVGHALPEVFRHPHHLPITKLACGPDAVHAAACSREIWLCDLVSDRDEILESLGIGSALVAFGHLGALCYTAHAAGQLVTYAGSSSQVRFVCDCASDPLALEGRPDSPWLVLGHGTNHKGGASWWHHNAHGLALRGSLKADSPVCSVAISPRGDRLALGTRAGLVLLLDPNDTGHQPGVVALTVTRQNRHPWLDQGVFGLAFSPDGRELFTVSSDGDAQRWDVEGQRLLHSLHWDMGRLRALAFSPDGQTAATITDSNRVVVWDID